ncbi:MAG: hypothetical protein AAF226_01745 [Verrucomicrobiota bacterium]
MTRRRWFYLIVLLLILLPVGVGTFYGHRIWQWRQIQAAGFSPGWSDTGSVFDLPFSSELLGSPFGGDGILPDSLKELYIDFHYVRASQLDSLSFDSDGGSSDGRELSPSVIRHLRGWPLDRVRGLQVSDWHASVSRGVERFPALEEFRFFSSTNFDDESFRALIEAAPDLERISVESSAFDGSGLEALSQLNRVRKRGDLFLLSLAGSSVNNEAVMQIPDGLKLRFLDLSRTDIEMGVGKSIERLKVHRLNLSDTQVRSVDISSQLLSQLESLNIADTEVQGSQWLADLGEGVVFPKMKHLRVVRLGLGDQDLPVLVKQFPNLEALCAYGNPFTADGLKELDKLPHLKFSDRTEHRTGNQIAPSLPSFKGRGSYGEDPFGAVSSHVYADPFEDLP